MVTETLTGEFKAAMVAHALQKSSPPPRSLQHQLAKNSTSTQWNEEGLVTGSQLLPPPRTGSLEQRLTTPHVCFPPDEGVTASRGNPRGQNVGRKTAAATGFYGLSPRSAPGRGGKGCDTRAVTHGLGGDRRRGQSRPLSCPRPPH